MSPFLFDADLGATELGQKARAVTTVAEASVLSTSDLFAVYAAAVARGDRARVAEIRLGADPQLLSELDGFDYLAAA